MTSPIDIHPGHLETVRDILRKNLPSGIAVWVFGSRANWTTKDSSDLDLALEGSCKIEYNILSALEYAFEESDLPYKVDVVDLNRVSSSFQRIIKPEMTMLPIDLNTQWREVILGDVLTLQRGFDLPKNKRAPGIYPVVASTKQVGSHEKAKVKGPGVVIGRSGSLGGAQYIKTDFWPLNTTLWVKDFKGNDRLFCYYLLKSLDLTIFNAGSGVPTLNRNHIYDLPIKLPPFNKQRMISYILGALDDMIELNHSMNTTLEAMVYVLFKSWFVDFDPVRAKMDGRWRPGESLPGLPAHYYDMFPDRLIDSESAKIPKGWTMTSLYHYAMLNPESWSSTNTPAEIKYVDLTNTKSGVIKSVNYYSWRNAPRRAQRILRPGDTIIGVVRPENKSYALIGDTDLTGSTGFAVLRPLHPKYRELIYLASTAPNNINRLAHSADGAAYPAISPKEVANTKVPLTDKSERVLHEFSNLAAPILDRMLLNNIENNILLTNRDALLPKLMSGDLQVPLRADRGRR